MPALGIMGVTTPAERLTTSGVEGSIYSRRRFVRVTRGLHHRDEPSLGAAGAGGVIIGPGRDLYDPASSR
jgi:hypothetical protein